MRLNSLAFRLIASAAVWSTAALLVGGLTLSALFSDYVERSFDDRLQVLLESLVAAAELEDGGELELSRVPGEPRFAQPYSGWYWQIDGPRGPLMRSRSLWDQSLESGGAAGSGALRRMRASGPDHQELRVVRRRIRLPEATSAFDFAVAGDLAEVQAEIARFNATLTWSLGLLVAGLIAAMVLQVHFGLQPLRRMRRALANIRAGRAERLAGRFPAEITPLAEELDALLDENAAVVERARTHVGNLAHALKTPLSVLANEAAAADGPLAELARRQSALMRRQVDHYLARARTAATTRTLGARVEVAGVVADLARTLPRIHADRDLEIAADCPAGLAFRGERQDLEEMVGNLMDNACKWAGGRVRVTAGGAADRVTIAIEDDGPGLDPGLAEQVVKRGARLDESVPGSGLGLAIVRDIARLYGGDIGLEKSELGGLKAVLDLPAAAAETAAAT